MLVRDCPPDFLPTEAQEEDDTITRSRIMAITHREDDLKCKIAERALYIFLEIMFMFYTIK